jgi:putative addiction module component (TIGR02574 family)
MSTYDSILGAASRLPTEDRLRLIEALWNSVPADVDLPLHAEWEQELTERVASIDNSTATTVDWATIRKEALARIGHGDIH